MTKKILLSTTLACFAFASGAAQAEDTVFVGHLADMSGPTAFVGKPYADEIGRAHV